MAQLAVAANTAGTFIRITVAAGTRHLDIGVADTMTVAELIPGFAKALGRLTPEEVYGGYTLVRPDGSQLRPMTSLVDQHVGDGDLLTLVVGVDEPEPKVYDDIVEAVGDAVEAGNRSWTATDSARVTLGAGAAFTLATALVLIGMRGTGPVASLVAGICALLLLITAAVLARVGLLDGGVVSALSACGLGAVGGFLAAGPGPLWGWPFVLAGAGCAACGMASIAAMPTRRELSLAPIAAGGSIAIAALAVQSGVLTAAAAASLLLAVAVSVGNAVAWLALSASRIPIVAPLTDAEIVATPPPVDSEQVARRAASAQRFILAGRVAVLLAVLVAIPTVVAQGPAGLALVVMALLGLMLSTRRSHSRGEVGVVMAGSLAGLVLGALAAAASQPSWAWPIMVGLTATAGVLIALALVPARPRLRLGRLADSLDLIALVSLLPLGVIAGGLV